ncbi:MotA/TolQ/ExbB proton channel family protein [Inquilinus sp. Marseille-Q2685]|uniref:MotA/TolQ/ExbB proton channel family protein n=1 Tax=Inquilinus sp. Marseille-Q2685 TaxID=2866581 RepID=UPI001CE4919C|nr:MotA/TolQ/ExbB proton channel family protein [Inquilinus sp. Marseille-Q2685]
MSHDLSILTLVQQADVIVQSVLALLVLASIGCWGIILDKLFTIGRLRRAAAAMRRRMDTEHEVDLIPADPAKPIVEAGLAQWHAADPEESRAEYRDRIERAMRRAAGEVVRRRELGLPFLATIGSAAPFVGLFGTVWGIMNSFTSIASSQDTSLAVVAPGIAEALFATAIGLVAAIPAVMAYNKFSTDLRRINQTFVTAIGQMAEHLSGTRRAAAARREAAE